MKATITIDKAIYERVRTHAEAAGRAVDDVAEELLAQALPPRKPTPEEFRSARTRDEFQALVERMAHHAPPGPTGVDLVHQMRRERDY